VGLLGGGSSRKSVSSWSVAQVQVLLRSQNGISNTTKACLNVRPPPPSGPEARRPAGCPGRLCGSGHGQGCGPQPWPAAVVMGPCQLRSF
jgi:hypothetical protein